MHKKITAILFIIVLAAGMPGLFSYAFQKIGGIIQGAPLINEEMPVAEESPAASNDTFHWLQNTIEDIVSGNLSLRYTYIEAYGFAQNALNRKIADDQGAVKLNNGYLSFLQPKSDDITDAAQKTIALGAYLKERGIDFLYVQAPGKISKFDAQTPPGITDYSNENTDLFLSLIDAVGVDLMDIRQAVRDDGLNPYEQFFITDHHWTPEAALWAFGKTAERLNTRYGFAIDEALYNPENFDYKIYEDWFLGSQGKRVGTLYGGVDDITLITPKFKTDFTLSIPSKNSRRSGAFPDAMFDYDKIRTKDYFGLSPYHTYIGGDFPIVQIENNMPADKKILLINDSFALPFAPFLASVCRELTMLDLRYYKELSAKEYIDQWEPDIVIILYSPRVEPMFFEFGE